MSGAARKPDVTTLPCCSPARTAEILLRAVILLDRVYERELSKVPIGALRGFRIVPQVAGVRAYRKITLRVWPARLTATRFARVIRLIPRRQIHEPLGSSAAVDKYLLRFNGDILDIVFTASSRWLARNLLVSRDCSSRAELTRVSRAIVRGALPGRRFPSVIRD